ncbi:MAG: sel1 repeat family protein [Sorangiineae bacterium PRO1]|nr:sel1 repeat family protein [Sorangiineae bacterium PRO1]
MRIISSGFSQMPPCTERASWIGSNAGRQSLGQWHPPLDAPGRQHRDRKREDLTALIGGRRGPGYGDPSVFEDGSSRVNRHCQHVPTCAACLPAVILEGMPSTFRLLSIALPFALALTLGATGCYRGKPGLGKASAEQGLAESLGEGSCRVVPQRATPLVMDWTSHERADLEVAMAEDGLALVRYDCKNLELIRGCAASGSYGYVGVEPKEDVLQLSDADEIRANLPAFGAKISAELQRGSALDLAFTTVGKRRAVTPSVARSALGTDPECQRATHFVRGAYLGAFAVKRGQQGRIAGAVEVFGAGASGLRSASSERTMKDGEASACKGLSVESGKPPARCGSALRLELVALDAAQTGADDAVVTECPEGLVPVAGKCTHRRASTGYVCNPAKPAECRAECDKGDLASCGYYGYALHYAYFGVAKDVARARALYEQACAKNVQYACSGLGIMYSRGEAGLPKDLDRDFALQDAACKAGEMRGCNNLAVRYEDRGEQEKAVELFERACSGGFAYSCANWGAKLKHGSGAPKNVAKALELFQKSCDAGQSKGCLELAYMYAGGLEVPQDPGKAAALYRRTCDGGRDTVGNNACRQLAWAHFKGSGVVQDVSRGLQYLKTACDDGHGGSCSDLASLHFSGTHVAKNEVQGNAILEAACQRDVGEGCAELGLSFQLGRAVPKDPQRALELAKKACSLDSGRGCQDQGFLLAHTAGHDPAQVRDLYDKACELGDRAGCYNAGIRYFEGILAARRDEKRGLAALEKSCTLGYARLACSYLARRHPDKERRVAFATIGCENSDGASCHLAGATAQDGRGTPKSDLVAADFYDRACKAKYAEGCAALASLYERSPSLPKDSARTESLRKERCLVEASSSNFWNCRLEWLDDICKDNERCTQLAYKLAKGTQGLKADGKLARKLWKQGCGAKHHNACWGLADAYWNAWGGSKDRAQSVKYVELACSLGADPKDCAATLEARKR